jgi:elongation factor P hydroxylase
MVALMVWCAFGGFWAKPDGCGSGVRMFKDIEIKRQAAS